MIVASGEIEQKTIQEIEDYILHELPRVLEKDTRFALFLEGLLSEKFPRRDEFSQMLAEMREMREDMNQLREDMNQLREDMNQLREDMNQLREETNRRFDEVNSRLDKQHKDILVLKRDVTRINASQQNLLRRYDGQEAWFKVNLGDLGNLKGKRLEEMFAAGLRYGLGDPDISAEQIRLRQRLKDDVFFPKGTEVDVIARNGELIVFEIKATGYEDDVNTFAHKMKIFRDQHPDVRVRGVLACMGAEHLRERCLEENIELLA